MKRISVKRHTIRKLWQLCERVVFAVPEIQREFVWDRRLQSSRWNHVVQQTVIRSQQNF